MSSHKIESFTVENSDGAKLNTKIFKPKEEIKNNLAIVLVHPYSVMVGCQALMKGIAAGLANRGYKAATFDMKGVGRSTGKASITGFAEIRDVIAVCNWVIGNLSTSWILLVGSSVGAPIAGSAVGQIEQVVGYVSIGYPFVITASILFGRHHKAILHHHGNSGWVHHCEPAEKQAKIRIRTQRNTFDQKSKPFRNGRPCL